MKYLFLFLVSLPAFSSTVFFADYCTKKEVKVATPNGTSLSLNFKDLDNDAPLRIQIKYKPSSIEKLKPHQIRVENYLIPARRISKHGEWRANFRLPNLKWMRSVERELFNYRVWDAEVVWYQNNNAQSAFTTFYHPQKTKAYYEVLSESLCSWEGRPQVDSKLYENLNQETMLVRRTTTESSEDINNRGISFGYGNTALEEASIGLFGASNFGWIFEEWQKQFENSKYVTVTRDYYLTKGESGLFYVRPTFSRHKALKYSWVKNQNGCGSFEAVSEGYLDIGKSLEDFIVIPSSYYGKESLLEFIEVVRPAIDSCKSFPINQVLDAEDIITSGNDELVYFYEAGRI